MTSLSYTILLFCLINNRIFISANSIELLLFNNINEILTTNEQSFINATALKTSQTCHTTCQHELNSIQLRKLVENLNIGEKFELNTRSVSVTLEKVSSNNLTNKHLLQSNGVQIRFPELNLNKTTTINLISFPSSSMLSLTLHDKSGEIIPIKNLTDPFEIIIPRQINTLIPSMIRQKIKLFLNNTKFQYHYLNLTHNLNLSIALHIEIESDNPHLSYLTIIRFSGIPDVQKNLIDETKLLCPKDRTSTSLKYTYFIPNSQVANHQWAILGIRELKECKNDNHFSDNIQFSSDYSLRIYASGCYYLDDHNNWQSDGLIVGSKTNENFTQCYSTHLTQFAGGFFVLPEPVPWADVDLDPKKNLTIYLTLILIILLYFITLAFSYYKDKQDAQKLLVIPLRDNNPRDTYLYQLVVFTGMRANAGTKSKVHFILSGNDDETSIRTLTADRRILDRGSIDSFILAVPRSLGQLNYLRIWHDNSALGSDASWFLKYILVRDLQTMETSYFICEKWLALEKDSGEIDRTIVVAGELEKLEVKHLLSKNAYRSMADNHLWFSIFAYHSPSANRFTRVQRCTCCFVLLFMSLLMNIYYYGQKQEIHSDELDQYGVAFGPFRISKDEISIGVSVELLIFFPSLLLVALFRRSKARHPRQISPVGEAIQNIRKEIYKTDSHTTTKEKRFLLPWWCLIIAYILSFLIVATSIAFTLIRGAQYGDEKVRQWLGAIVTSFCTSVVLTQPLKVLSLAIVFMFFCRRKSQVEAFVEQEDPIEDFTVSTADAHRKFPPKSILAKTRLDPYRVKREKEALKKLREIRLKEIKSWSILRELFFLLLFLGTLYAISYANRDVESAHRMVNYLRREYLQIDYNYQYEYDSTEKKNSFIFENIRSFDDYWLWLENVFIKKYNETRWQIKNPNILKDLTNLETNVFIGAPVLRQLRVKNDSCPRKALHGHMEIFDCNLPYTWYNEAREPYGYNIVSDPQSEYSPAFQYTPSEDKTLVYSTSYATYLSGGYIYKFPTNNMKEYPLYHIQQVLSGLKDLREHNWIDRYTRAIFLTFGLYNPNVNLFVYCSLLIEQLPTTFELIVRPSFQPFKLVQLYTGADLIYCLIYLSLILYYMYAEIKLIFETGKSYIKHFWSYIHWGIIICSWFGVVIHILRQNEMKKMAQSLKNGDKTINLQFFSYLDSLLAYLLGFCCFFATIKVLRLLRFNRRLSLLHLTLAKSGRQLLGFFIMFSFVFVAFTSLFYLLFSSHIEQYSTWLDTALTCFDMISLHFSTLHALKDVNSFIAALSLFLFMFLAIFLLSNMFISIIVDNFNMVRQEQLKRANDIELLQFTISKMRQWIGMRTRRKENEKIINPVRQFPEKMDQLMLAIDKVYKN